ncbi:MAG: peptidylprolyl isomerase [Spirochaetaceae bacterium]|jgi:peptidyl-prolyl cis-trans isomerase A (cyclophilin A)|nr:peptidylprolyl isomerase [Spirochaetaceae bacterium]
MIKKIILFLSMLFISSLTLFSQDQNLYSTAEKGESLNIPGLYAKMETSKGSIIFYLDYKNTPLTSMNFIKLAEQGFYNGLKFYRDIENYAIFSGDPENNGSSDAGYNFPMEINSEILHDGSGILSMDGVSGLSNSSRFFISKSSDSVLDGKYTAFGFITEGKKVLDKLKRGESILSIEVIHTGSDALAFKYDEIEFARISKKIMDEELEAFRSENPEVVSAIETLGEGVQKTLTGIYYKTTLPGNGVGPKAEDMVSVHYTAMLVDGTVFDSSYSRETPFEFTVGTKSVISGWDESVMNMTIGEKRTVIIPPSLAYGDTQTGPIPPGSWLMFEIEFLGIK